MPDADHRAGRLQTAQQQAGGERGWRAQDQDATVSLRGGGGGASRPVTGASGEGGQRVSSSRNLGGLAERSQRLVIRDPDY
eukprot:626500-Rhodomonas_salina.4